MARAAALLAAAGREMGQYSPACFHNLIHSIPLYAFSSINISSSHHQLCCECIDPIDPKKKSFMGFFNGEQFCLD
jgi:hypothetical protein